MTKQEIFNAYLDLWEHVENGTINNENFFELRSRFRHVSSSFYQEISRDIKDKYSKIKVSSKTKLKTKKKGK